MKIKLLSDLHIEFGVQLKSMPYFKYDGEDVLVLAGDIDCGTTAVIKAVEAFHAEGYPHIVYVAGNHEYYGSLGIADFNAKMRRYSEENSSWFHFLDKDWVEIGDSIFIGATLWSNFRNDPFSEMSAARGIADFRRIPNFSTRDCATMNEQDTQFIKMAIKTLLDIFPNHRIFVVTHFLPAYECVDPYYKIHGGVLNDYFANRMEDYLLELEKPIKWLYGHTHTPGVQFLNNVTLVANPYGYHGYESTAKFSEKRYV